MGLVACYDADGNPHQKETVDARECVKYCGFTMRKPLPEGAELSGDGSGQALPEIDAAQLIADDNVRESAKAAQVIVQAAPEKRAYHRKQKG